MNCPLGGRFSDKTIQIMLHIVFFSFSFVEDAEVNRSAPFYLSSIVCPCYLSYGFRNDVSLFERQCEGFQMEPLGEGCQKQRELKSLRKSGKSNDLAINSIVYMAKYLVSNVSMKHLCYISNSPNRR